MYSLYLNTKTSCVESSYVKSGAQRKQRMKGMSFFFHASFQDYIQ